MKLCLAVSPLVGSSSQKRCFQPFPSQKSLLWGCGHTPSSCVALGRCHLLCGTSVFPSAKWGYCLPAPTGHRPVRVRVEGGREDIAWGRLQNKTVALVILTPPLFLQRRKRSGNYQTNSGCQQLSSFMSSILIFFCNRNVLEICQCLCRNKITLIIVSVY